METELCSSSKKRDSPVIARVLGRVTGRVVFLPELSD